MTYAKLISTTAIDRNPPRRATIDGRAVAGELPAEYLATLGYYPLDESAPEPQDAPEGHRYEARYEVRYDYDDPETPPRVVRSWVLVADPPPPPVDYSKRKLYRVFLERGVWPQVKAWMEAQGVWEDWEYATTLASDDELMVAAIPALMALLGVTDAEMREILAACEAGAQ